MLNVAAGEIRVFLFHSPNASADPKAAMDSVNAWLGRDRSTSQYPNLKIVDITVTPDGAGGVYTLVVCNLGEPRSESV
jgi:hypothetical protein